MSLTKTLFPPDIANNLDGVILRQNKLEFFSTFISGGVCSITDEFFHAKKGLAHLHGLVDTQSYSRCWQVGATVLKVGDHAL